MPEFFFQRYVNGERMADDVLITKQATLEDAIPAALRLCRNSPKSVLVHIPQTPWRDIESAPKDGTRILAFAAPLHGTEILAFSRGHIDYYGVAEWAEADPNLHRPKGVWIWDFLIRPTHWMPLPEPPR